MFPPALANAKQDASKIGVRMGMIFTVMSIGTLCGPPIAGALIDNNHGEYLYAQMFGGSALACGALALVLLIPRFLSVGKSLLKQI